MLALTTVYVMFGALPSARNAFYGIGPVVVGIFAVSVYRLGKAAIKERSQIAIALAAAAVMFLTPVGLVLPLLAAGCAGIAIFYSRSRRVGLICVRHSHRSLRPLLRRRFSAGEMGHPRA
jgi:chromate transporter